MAKIPALSRIITSSSDEKLARRGRSAPMRRSTTRATPGGTGSCWSARADTARTLLSNVGGADTLPRLLKAVAAGGRVAVLGVIAGGGAIDPVPLIPKAVRMQGIYVGHSDGFEAMNVAIAHAGLRPVIEHRVAFADAPEIASDLPRGSVPIGTRRDGSRRLSRGKG